MKKIGLTQRVEIISNYQERRDCLDQNWVKLMLSLGYMPVPLPNVPTNMIPAGFFKQLELDGLLLTGGNDLAVTLGASVAPERDDFEVNLINHAIDEKLPVLGVCRGMQMLNVFFGGQIAAVEGHVAVQHLIKHHKGQSSTVNSFHDWGIYKHQLATNLVATAISEDGLIEGFEHESLPINGMMWHPERHNQDDSIGTQLIKETFK